MFPARPQPGGGGEGGPGPPTPAMEGRGAAWLGHSRGRMGGGPSRAVSAPSQEVKPLLCPSLGVAQPIPRSLPELPNTPGSLSPGSRQGAALSCGPAWKKLINPNQEEG